MYINKKKKIKEKIIYNLNYEKVEELICQNMTI